MIMLLSRNLRKTYLIYQDFAKKQARKDQAYYKTDFDETFWFKHTQSDNNSIDLSPLELINANYNFYRDRLNIKNRLLNTMNL